MELSGQYIFETDQDTVWNLLMDPQAIANALPGVDKLDPIEGEENAWRANAKLGIAAISGRYSGTVRMSEQNPPEQYRLTVNGQGQQSIIDGSALITLSYDEEHQRTVLEWEAEANISGKLIRIGQRVVKSAANLMSRQFFGALAEQIEAKDE